MKNILVFSTGGTIEMLPGRGGLTAGTLSGMDMEVIRSIPGAKISLKRYSNLPSPHITPVMMADIACELKALEVSGEYHGVVVTHGTDTLEETAFMADLHLEGSLPVVFTAAMRSSSELGVDGPRNITGAVRVACETGTSPGVTVVLNDEIHAAGRVTKTCTSNVSSFSSPGYGPLGFVDDDKVIYHRLPIWRLKLPSGPLKLETRVGIVRTAAGFGADVIDYMRESGYRGIVVEAMGRGNVHPETADALERAVEDRIVVAITSRCFMGRVLGVYAYPGGGADLIRRGAVSAGDMAGNKIRILLMACLGAGMNTDDVRQLLSGL